MKNIKYIICATLLTLATATAVPGDKSSLGFTERSSLTEAFDQLKGYRVSDGYKTEDERGYTISASATKGGKEYRIRAWVNKAWTSGRVISVTPE